MPRNFAKYPQMPAQPLYTLRHVQQIYNKRQVLNISELEVFAGEILGLVGPSGAGKSSLLRLLSFLEMPASGTIRYQNQLVTSNHPPLAQRRQVTMVFQHPQLLKRSVLYNITYGLKLRQNHQHNHQANIQAISDQLGLTPLWHTPAHTLSGGEIQRVALARALLLQPKLLLLDEPTANLDPYNINLIEEIIQQVNQQKTTIVIVTHNIFQAQRLTHRVALLLNGELIEVADTATFFNEPTQSQTAAFTQGKLIY